MAKKNPLPESKQSSASAIPSSKSFTYSIDNLVPLVVCALYFAVHFIPDFDGYDAMGAQWVYMAGLDAVVTLYILARKNDYQLATAGIIKNTFSKLYIAFFILSGISIITAINPTEGWVCYVRLIATIVAYFNISILLNGKLQLFKILAQILGLILLVESYQCITQFLNGISTTPLNDLIMGLKGESGNKNIFAAGLVIKIPFVIYCIHRSKLWGKILNIIIFILGSLAIFIVNARAAYLSLVLILLMYIAFSIILYLRERKLEQALYRVGSILIPVIVAFFLSQIELSSVLKLQDNTDNQPQNFGSVTERLASVAQTQDESNQVRFRLWTHALDYTKHHPLMGCGIGNWKIASIPYQRVITNDLYVPIHAHNDFLEAFAELGIPGGLLYLSLFVFLIIFTYRTFYSDAEEETKLVAVFSFMALTAYMVDAMFNFPLERPISQVFFAFVTAVNIGAYIKGREEQGEKETATEKTPLFKPVYGLISLLLLVPTFYVTYLTYQSLIIQRNVLADLNNEPLKLDYKVIVPAFPSIPNLSATAQPIEAIKGRYLYEAGKFDEALVLLDKGRKANPVIGYSEFLKAGLYFKENKLDSAFRNASVAFYTRPKAKTYYQTFIAVLAKMKDTINIQKAFHEYDKYRHHSYGWNMYLMGMLNAERNQGKVFPNLLPIVDSGLRVFPGDSDLLVRRKEIQAFVNVSTVGGAGVNFVESQKQYALGVADFGSATAAAGKNDAATAAGFYEKSAGHFLKSASINPGDFTAIENAAICYFNMKQWNKAIGLFDKELAMKVSVNGKPEYFKGIALINIGKKDDGCTIMQISRSKGWADAAAILKSNCGK